MRTLQKALDALLATANVASLAVALGGCAETAPQTKIETAVRVVRQKVREVPREPTVNVVTEKPTEGQVCLPAGIIKVEPLAALPSREAKATIGVECGLDPNDLGKGGRGTITRYVNSKGCFPLPGVSVCILDNSLDVLVVGNKTIIYPLRPKKEGVFSILPAEKR